VAVASLWREPERREQLSFGAVEFISKLVEGKFPDYAKVIPVANPKQFLIGRESLMQALSRVAGARSGVAFLH